MTAAAGRRLLAEFTGTGLLVAVVVGSGIAVTRLTTDGALRLLVNSLSGSPRPDHNPPASSTPLSSRSWPRSGSTSPASSPSR